MPGRHQCAVEGWQFEWRRPAAHPGWEQDDSSVTRRYGDEWLAKQRTPVLAVPSVPGQPIEWNYVINPNHPEAGRIRTLDPFDIIWDARLFGPLPGTVHVTP